MKIPSKFILSFLFVMVFLLFVFYRGLLIFKYSADIGGSENSVVYIVQRILAGFSPYSAPQLSPYAIAQYPPLYYYFDVLFAKLCKIGPDDVMPLFVINRMFGFVCNCLYLLAVFFITRRILLVTTVKSLAVVVLSFIFLESPSFARPDSLNLAIFFWSLFFFLKRMTKRVDKYYFWLILSSFLCGLCLLAKQTSLVLPFLIATWLLIEKKNKDLLVFLLVFVTVTFISLYLLKTLFGIKQVYQNIVLGIDNGISLSWFWDFIVSYLFGSFGTLWILTNIVLYTYLKRSSTDINNFFRILSAGLFFFGLLFSLKWGSWISYFTEWWTTLFILTAYYWDQLKKVMHQFTPHFSYILISFILLIKIFSITYPTYSDTRTVFSKTKTSYDIDRATASWIYQNSKHPNEYVFVNTSNIHQFLNNFLFRKSVLPQYEIVTYTLYNRKIFDYSDFKKSLGDGRVKFVIANANFPGLKYMDVEMKNFKKAYQNQVYTVYQLDSIPE